MLLFAICAATDKQKGPVPPERAPIAVFVVMLGISVSIGAQTGQLIASVYHPKGLSQL